MSMVIHRDNICVINEYSLVKNLYSDMLVESDSLVDMSSLEYVTLIINNL